MFVDESFCYDYRQDILWWIILLIPAFIEIVSFLCYSGCTLNHFAYLTIFCYVTAVIDIAFLYALTVICGIYYIYYIFQQTYYFVWYHWSLYQAWPIILWLFTVVCLLMIGATMLMYIILEIVSEQFMWQIHLPYQTRSIVWVEYVSLSVFLLPQICGKFSMKHLLYLVALMGCLFFPWFYSQQSDMRLHHSFYGLVLIALPVRCLQWLGLCVCLDSLMYVWFPERGYWKDETFVSYDCINVLWENVKLVYTLYLLYTCLQISRK